MGNNGRNLEPLGRVPQETSMAGSGGAAVDVRRDNAAPSRRKQTHASVRVPFSTSRPPL